MIYINTTKTDRYLNFFLRKLYSEGSPPEYIDPNSLGQLSNNRLSISSEKIKIINPLLDLKDIAREYENIALSFILKKSKLLESIKLDNFLNNHEIYEIIIQDSILEYLELGYELNRRTDLEITILNTEIKILRIQFFPRSNGNISNFNFSIENLKSEIIIVESQIDNQISLGYFDTELLYAKTEKLKLSNCKFKYPIFQNLTSLKLSLKNSILELPKNLPYFRDFESKINSNYKQNYIDIKENEIISSLKYLKSLNESAPFAKTIERYYSYFDSRRGLFNKILYSYTKYYYNILFPLLGSLLSLFLIQTLLQHDINLCDNSTIGNLLLPFDFYKNCILANFKLSLDIRNLSFLKISILFLSGFSYFSFFSLSLAIKRRFGYNKLE
ncbi:hypothetical protein [Leptospira bandrabouensis]|uniref:Uncharacterized protein n=1 Tax=Leptospira bandrabouensis TaxID=2484903 RepID=A0A6H3NVC9_9LEPT|nr:hypothetical protein [Leptospira bandrabouensis]TGN16858.1 hypothetical protein EHR08_00010 [Leptospira bandrabouensis]